MSPYEHLVWWSSTTTSYGSWIYDYLCNRCQLPQALWVRIPLRRGVLNTTLCDKVCHWPAAGQWFSPDTPVSSTNKTDHHDITEILLKVVLNTITLNEIDNDDYVTHFWATQTLQKSSGAPERYAVPVPLATPIMLPVTFSVCCRLCQANHFFNESSSIIEA
jgi:hypothetical protein